MVKIRGFLFKMISSMIVKRLIKRKMYKKKLMIEDQGCAGKKSLGGRLIYKLFYTKNKCFLLM